MKYPRMFLLSLLSVFVLSIGVGLPVHADPIITVATWNIENLRPAGSSGPTKDFAVLTDLADQLNADVIALQEVDGPEAAEQVFDPDEYNFYFSSRNHVQLTGFAVRKGLPVVQHPDLVALNVSGGLRHGTDITVTINEQHIRLLSVHLKSSCHSQDPLPVLEDNQRPESHCEKLSAQIPVLEAWIDARAAEGIPFIVLGDFNRRFNEPDDTFFPQIDDAEPANADLVLVTEGKLSACLNGRYPEYIDHIVLDRLSAQWRVADSFTQLLFDAELEDVVSDHCPLSVALDIDTAPVQPDPPTLMEELIDLIIDQLTEFVEQLRQLRHG